MATGHELNLEWVPSAYSNSADGKVGNTILQGLDVVLVNKKPIRKLAGISPKLPRYQRKQN